MKILISELTTHQKNLPHLYKLFSYGFEAKIFVHKNDLKYLQHIPHNKQVIISTPKSFAYWNLLFRSYKYDYIFLSTGPEYVVGPLGPFHTLGFFFLVLFNRNKIIVHIRNVNNYLPETHFSSNKLVQFIRVKTAPLIKRYTFDSNLTLNYFNLKFTHKNALASVISIFYSDVRSLGLTEIQHPKGSKLIKIAMPGRIDPIRKDYSILLKVLSQLTNEERSQLNLIILGECRNTDSKKIITDLEKYVKIVWKDGYLTDDEFEEMGIGSDVLFAPLTDQFGYGITKETGAFGDAIYLHKKVIIPQFACLNGEFDEISLYYKDENSLLKIFKKIINEQYTNFLTPSDTFLEKYSTLSVFNRIKSELKL
jgi:hypothetical protein